jgi:hypothetical protein
MRRESLLHFARLFCVRVWEVLRARLVQHRALTYSLSRSRAPFLSFSLSVRACVRACVWQEIIIIIIVIIILIIIIILILIIIIIIIISTSIIQGTTLI